jgi:hypothetical protein
LTEVSFSGFIRAREASPSLYFREACFDVAASAQTDQQFCDFMRVQEYAETGSSREESRRTIDLRECGVGMGNSWYGEKLVWGTAGMGNSWRGEQLVWGKVGVGNSWYGEQLVWGTVGLLIEKRRLFYILIIENS